MNSPGLHEWFILVNPTSGNGSSKRKWPRIAGLLAESNINFIHRFTSHPKHATELAMEAIGKGFRKIACVGGDGTIHEVINGIMKQEFVKSTDVLFAVLPVGTGNDWIRTHGISKKLKVSIDKLKNGHEAYQDLGEIQFDNHPDQLEYFNNLAGIGFDAQVVRQASRFKNLGSLSYVLAAAIGLFNYRSFSLKIKIDNSIYEEQVMMVVIGLGQYSGGGMRLTENPDPVDGLLDISIVRPFKPHELLINIRRLFSGSIVDHPKVKTLKSSVVQISSPEPTSQDIEADGEIIGAGCMTIRIKKGALRFVK